MSTNPVGLSPSHEVLSPSPSHENKDPSPTPVNC